MENVVLFPKLGLEFVFKNSFNIGSFRITLYGILIAAGLLLALFYGYKNFKRFGVDENKAIDAIIGGIIGGILGARIYYVAFTWDEFGLDFSSLSAFWDSFSRIFKTWEGGMAIYGSIIGAFLVGIIVAKLRKLRVLPLMDVGALGFLIGQAVGRWGNFFNVEAFGSNTNLPWGMTGPSIVGYLQSNISTFAKYGITVDPSLPVHPTFLYESLWCAIGFIVLHFWSKKRSFDGEIFLLYLVWYGAGRTVIEGFRTDSLMIGYLRVSQILSILLVLTALVIIIVVRSKIKSNNDPEYLKLYVNTKEWADLQDEVCLEEDKSGSVVLPYSADEDTQNEIHLTNSRTDDNVKVIEDNDKADNITSEQVDTSQTEDSEVSSDQTEDKQDKS